MIRHIVMFKIKDHYRPDHLAFIDFFLPYRQQTASVDYEI